MVTEKTMIRTNAHAHEIFEQARAYERGKGVKKDRKKAAELYIEAARAGDLFAKAVFVFDFDLKNHMHVSSGRFEVIRSAAELGYADAQFSYGGRYRAGIDVEKDYDEAFKWISKAAQQGHPDAIYYLGAMYRRGRGVEADVDKADELTHIAADLGCAPAMHMIGKRHLKTHHEKAVRFIAEAASQGYRIAAYDLGLLYLEGTLVDEDTEKGLALLKQAVGKEYEVASYKLGEIYEAGLYGVESDMRQAIHWYKKAADVGYVGAELRLGEIYEKGIGVDRDLRQCIKYYKLADRHGWHYARDRIYALFA